MKFITTILLCVFISIGYSQNKINPDARIIANQGQAKAEELVKYRPNYYNFFVYRLDHTCSVVDKKEAKKYSPEKNHVFIKDGKELTKEIIESKDFNFVVWGIEPDKKITKYYLLSDGNYMKVLSHVEVSLLFRDSPRNNKNLY